MFVDLFCQSNYVNYNVKLAKMLGLEAAVYLSVVCDLFNESVSRNKISKEGYFNVDRNQVKEKTTLLIQSQRDIDKRLSKINLIKVKESDMMFIDMNVLTSMFISENTEALKKLTEIVRTPKRTKQDVIKEELKMYIRTDNAELRDAYCDWIDSVMQKQGWMSKKSVLLGQDLIDKHANHNLDIAIEILNIASVGAYRDIQWALNTYYDNHKQQNSTINLTKDVPSTDKIVKVTDEIF